ncbi:MAG: hypothetical protein GY810_24290 [Aureispira sp.]|nr:hypothetical protein [Aureispira sp.]
MGAKLAKIRSRLGWVSGYGGLQLVSLVGQFLISYFVIVYSSQYIWGEVVSCLIVLNLAAMLCNWGQNTYLLREFSKTPMNIAQLWQESFTTRLVFFVATGLIFLFLYKDDFELYIYLCLWLFAIFIIRSVEPLNLYFRAFKWLIFLECISLAIFGVLFYWSIDNISPLLLVKLYVIWSWFRALGYLVFYKKTIFSVLKWRFSLMFLKGAFPFFIPAMVGFVQSRIDLYGVAYYLPKKTLGEYQIFFKYLMLFIVGLRIVISPFLKTIYRLPFKSLTRLSKQAFLAGIFLTGPIIIALYFILPWVYGIRFSVYLYIAGYLMLVPFFGYALQTHLLIKHHLETKMAWGFFWGACCNLICNYLLIPTYGALGAIISTAIVQWLLLIGFSYLVKTIRINNEVT